MTLRGKRRKRRSQFNQTCNFKTCLRAGKGGIGREKRSSEKRNGSPFDFMEVNEIDKILSIDGNH
jgi:hypothetical protein